MEDIVAKWKLVCDMTYGGATPVEKIVIPDIRIPDDYEYLTLGFYWEQASKKRVDDIGTFVEPTVVRSFKELHAPRILFEYPGVYTWFAYSFPSCDVYLW